MSLDEDMASLKGMSILDMAGEGTKLMESPEIQKALQEAQKALQGLKLGSDPI
jgi:hypothetical protein